MKEQIDQLIREDEENNLDMTEEDQELKVEALRLTQHND